jgi:hypothetical protein
MIKLTKKTKDEFKKIITAPVTNTLEPIDFTELKVQKERELAVTPKTVDFGTLKGFFNKE